MNVTKNKIKQLQSGKKIHDGRGLYFFKKGDKCRWSFRYQRDGRCHEMGNYDQNVVEFCMAHKLHSRVEGAYMRSDLYYKRVKLMNDWARLIIN